MRAVKLALITTIVLLFGNGLALGLEVNKKVEAPGAPAQIWGIAGDFCAIKTWHPLVADCKQTNEGDTIVRTLTAKNGATIKEKLVESDDRSYSYQIIESPLPVKNYNAKLWVEEGQRPSSTVIHWDAEFDANGASDDAAKKKINDILAVGLKGIKKIAVDKTEGQNVEGPDTGN
jgi:Polyketide cyclase / dehydrase and lipid transport